MDDTRIGGASSKFPATHRSAIVASGSAEPEERRRAFEKIVAAYWKPVYTFIRFKWPQSNEDAKDLTQAFFTRAMEKGFFKDYRPEKASFRTFVRTCVMNFIINESKSANRLKRGGGVETVTAQEALDEAEEPSTPSLDEFFEREWVRHMFELAVDDLREMCNAKSKATHFAIFERYDLGAEKTAYADLAVEFGMALTDVTNYLAWSRREFRRLVLERIREITGDDTEFRNEARVILGAGRDHLG